MASQSITGQDLQFTQDNRRCFAYSGDVSATIGASGTAFDFTTGSEYIEGSFYYTADSDGAGAQYIVVQINFNGTTVIYSAERRDLSFNDTLWPIIIPPHTRVVVTYTTPGTTVETTLLFTGRVYEYLPVRN